MKNLIDKTAVEITTVPGKTIIRDIRGMPIKPLTVASVAPLDAIDRGQASLVVGAYKGALAYVDLDKAVVQPLVAAERLHIQGILNSRLEDYDLQTISWTAGDAIATSAKRARLIVPAGQVWFVHAVAITAAKDATSGITFNWRCSLWPDVVATGGTPDPDGQGYFAADVAGTANTAIANNTLFGSAPAAPAAADTETVSRVALTQGLRLPAGSVLTLCASLNTAVPTGTAPITIGLFGYVGKALVS